MSASILSAPYFHNEEAAYQHCSSDHLHRYLAEFDFRYKNRTALGVSDGQRADAILSGVVGKRLTYKTAD